MAALWGFLIVTAILAFLMLLGGGGLFAIALLVAVVAVLVVWKGNRLGVREMLGR